MRAAVPLGVFLVSALLLAGCFGDADVQPQEDENGATPPPPPRPRGQEPEEPTGRIGLFHASPLSGQAPVEVTFRYAFTTNDEAATWVLDFGDGASQSGGASEDRGIILHTYEVGGELEATFSLSYGGDTTDTLSVTLKLAAPFVLPDPAVFEYGPTLGCVLVMGPETCVSFHAGPDAPAAIDGIWQALDERYWRLDFLATNEPNAYEDTDCIAFDSDLNELGTFHQGGGPCGGTLPPRTAYLFMFSFVASSPGMKLEFFLPTE